MESNIIIDVIFRLSYLLFLFVGVMIIAIFNLKREEKRLTDSFPINFNLEDIEKSVKELNLVTIRQVSALKKDIIELAKLAEHISIQKAKKLDSPQKRSFAFLNISKGKFAIAVIVVLIIIALIIFLAVNPYDWY